MSMQAEALGAAASPIHPLPALDIEELLDAQPWGERSLNANERKLLVNAKEYLEHVIAGKEIVKQTAISGIITPDVVSLDAYEYTRNALVRSMSYPKYGFVEIEKVVSNSYLAIEAILDSDAIANTLAPDMLGEASKLFATLAHYSYSRGMMQK